MMRDSGKAAVGAGTVRTLEAVGFNSMVDVARASVDELVPAGIRRDLARQVCQNCRRRMRWDGRSTCISIPNRTRLVIPSGSGDLTHRSAGLLSLLPRPADRRRSNRHCARRNLRRNLSGSFYPGIFTMERVPRTHDDPP